MTGTIANPIIIGAVALNGEWSVAAGYIDDVRIYNRALTAAEVASMCYTTNGVTYPVPGK